MYSNRSLESFSINSFSCDFHSFITFKCSLHIVRRVRKRSEEVGGLCMPSSIHFKKANSTLERVCNSSLSSAIFNVFLLAFGISDTLQLFDDTRIFLFVTSFKWPWLFYFIFFIFSSFMHHMGCPISQGMNMAWSQTHHWNSWVTQTGGCWAGQSCLCLKQQRAVTVFSHRLKRSHFLREACVSPDCSIIFALAPNILTFSGSKAITISF